MRIGFHKVCNRLMAGTFFLLSLLLFGVLNAQQPINKWLEKGESARLDQAYPDAIKYFEWAARKKGDPRPYIGLGKCYRSLRDYKKAAKYFGEAVNYPSVSSETFFLLAQSLLSTGDKAGAEKWFRIYAENTPEKNQVIKWENLKTLFDKVPLDSSQLEISRFSFNTTSSDFSAVPVGPDLYFCSSRKTNSTVVHLSTINNSPLIDLFVVPDFFSPSVRRKMPKPVSGLNTKYNEGPMCFTKDLKTIYFTRNNSDSRKLKENRLSLNKLRIYRSDRENGDWSEPVDLPFNSDDFAVGHPSLDKENQKLFFVSDMPGGYGGTDIYYVHLLSDGKYGNPQNLGPKINTKGNEMFPFIAHDGTLYFASDQHLGFGGLDIFKSIPSGNSWSSVHNIGLPVNSPDDDFAYILYPDGKNGLFSSNRGKSADNDDIYEFRMNRPLFECAPQEENRYCYRFSEEGSFDFETDSSSNFIYEWDFGDGGRSFGLVVEHCFPGPGDYMVQLNLIDTVSDFVFMNEATYDVEVRDIEQIFIQSPDTVAVDEEFKISGNKSIFKGVEIKKYYWDIGGADQFTGEDFKYSFSEPGQYEIQLGVVGNEPGSSEDIQGCRSKMITVLEPERLQEINDSLGNGYLNPNDSEQMWLRYSDSLQRRQEFALVDRIKQIRDSMGSRTPIVSDGLSVDGYDFQDGDDPLDPSSTSGDPMISDWPPTPEKRNLSDPLPFDYKKSVLLTVLDEEIDTLIQLRLPAKVKGRRLLIPLKGTPLWEPGMEEQLELSLDEDLADLVVRKITGSEEPEMVLEKGGKRIASLMRKCEDCLPVSTIISYPDRDLSYEIVHFRNIKEIIEKRLVVRVSNIYFDHNSHHLRRRYQPYLDQVAKILVDNPEIRIEISGHTDRDGSNTYNDLLSKRRAYSIAKYFILSGYQLENFITNGYGESLPVDSSNTSFGKQLNRRVEFRFLPRK